ncbi:MAG: hypothetical protein Phog2KO_22200 [Phototrophicaceae bacterium]
MTFTFDTTTLKITKPEQFSELESKFTLVRYILPFDWAKRRGKHTYSALHVQLRQQLDLPYYAFQHDKLSGTKQRVIYVLYPSVTDDNEFAKLGFDFLRTEENPLDYDIVQFNDVALHIVIKLLQSQFSSTYPYFASKGKYYVHSQPEGDGWHTCVEIVVHGALSNQDVEGNDIAEQEFLISGHSRYFVESTKQVSALTDNNKKYNAYFKIVLNDDFVAFEQLNPSEIDKFKGKLYYLYQESHNKPHVDYHNQDNKSVDIACRGYILFEFINRFQNWLFDCEIKSEKKSRDWERYKISNINKSLNLEYLDKIFLYDARWNKSKHKIEKYRQILARFMPDITWEVVDALSLVGGLPTLVIQDANKADYKESKKKKGHLFGEEDKYEKIKRDYGDVPTQFVNINPNKPKDSKTREGYLDYNLIELREGNDNDNKRKKSELKNLRLKFKVIILQLYLKDLIVNKRAVDQYLPVSGNLENPTTYAYLRKENHWDNGVKVTYRVLLEVTDNQLNFTRIEGNNWDVLEAVCRRFKYDWNEVEENLLIKYCKDEHLDKDEDDLTKYDLIFMPNMVVEIEDLDETVLYKYDIIQERLGGKTQKRQIDQFLLCQHFELIRKKRGINISLATLRDFGLLGENARTPNEGSEAQGVALYRQLKSYDNWLLETFGNTRISYNQLTNDKELENEVAVIFGWENKKQNKLGVLFEDYKDIWEIGSATANDVVIDKGIFFDVSDNAYRVASTDGNRFGKQDRAFRIRRFDIVYGDTSKFNLALMQPLLETMSVDFVRYNRYTVYPYFFALLNTYINEYLR